MWVQPVGVYASRQRNGPPNSGFGTCPVLWILNITFKYLLEIVYPQYLSDVQVGHLPTPIITVFHLGGNGLVRH